MKQDFTRYKEPDSVTKWNSAFLFTNKPTRKIRDGGTEEEREYRVKARHAVEAHQESKRLVRIRSGELIETNIIWFGKQF